MSFQIPTTTAAAAPTFSFGASGGGDAGVTKPLTFGAVATTTAAPTTVAPAAVPTLGTGGAGFFGTAAPTAIAAPTATSTAPNTGTIAKSSAAPTDLAAVAPKSVGATVPAAGGFANLTTATKTTDSAVVSSASQMTYNQLEEHINKWTLELEEQEKVFTDQATQINAWDNILINNNQKIIELNEAVQKVKADQQTLEQELEFIATQHKELEESIVPLQKEFMKIPQVDVERSQTYLLVENLDTQLKQMSEDLKEIIDNLNESNKGQDSTDPIIQIGKILNAHMSSLQWIESSSGVIVNKLEEITKMHDNFKRDSERSFRSAYYN